MSLPMAELAQLRRVLSLIILHWVEFSCFLLHKKGQLHRHSMLSSTCNTKPLDGVMYQISISLELWVIQGTESVLQYRLKACHDRHEGYLAMRHRQRTQGLDKCNGVRQTSNAMSLGSRVPPAFALRRRMHDAYCTVHSRHKRRTHTSSS